MARTQTFADLEVGLSIRNKLNSITDWNSAYSYNQYDVTHFNGDTYFSIIDNNLGNEPDISPLQWVGEAATLQTGSTYPITSSWAINSISSSFSSYSFAGPWVTVSGSGLQLYDAGLGQYVTLTSNNEILTITPIGPPSVPGPLLVSALSASWASSSLTASQGNKAWGSIWYAGGTNFTASTYGCSVSRISVGNWGVTLNHPTPTSPYPITINAFSGSYINPTASVCFANNIKTTTFSMSFANVTTPITPADFSTASFQVSSN